jgi:hypothetical protein
MFGLVVLRLDTLQGFATREGDTHFDDDIPENTGTYAIVELLFSVN